MLLDPVAGYWADPAYDVDYGVMLFDQISIPNRLVVRHTISQVFQSLHYRGDGIALGPFGAIWESFVSALSPEFIIHFKMQNICPESEADSCHDIRNRDGTILVEAFHGLNQPIGLVVQEYHRLCVLVPLSAKFAAQFPIDGISQCYFQGLQRSVEGSAERCIPKIELESFGAVAF